jgi:hypothetical protein
MNARLETNVHQARDPCIQGSEEYEIPLNGAKQGQRLNRTEEKTFKHDARNIFIPLTPGRLNSKCSFYINTNMKHTLINRDPKLISLDHHA